MILKYKLEMTPVFESEYIQYYKMIVFQRSDEDPDTFEVIDIFHFDKLSDAISFLNEQLKNGEYEDC